MASYISMKGILLQLTIEKVNFSKVTFCFDVTIRCYYSYNHRLIALIKILFKVVFAFANFWLKWDRVDNIE